MYTLEVQKVQNLLLTSRNPNWSTLSVSHPFPTSSAINIMRWTSFLVEVAPSESTVARRAPRHLQTSLSDYFLSGCSFLFADNHGRVGGSQRLVKSLNYCYRELKWGWFKVKFDPLLDPAIHLAKHEHVAKLISTRAINITAGTPMVLWCHDASTN